jgi:peptidyl-prolyl cis-trans isomerase B (cyclophilin B)
VPTNEQRRATAKRKLERQLERRAAAARRRRLLTIIGSAIGAVLVIGAVATVVIITNRGSNGNTASATTSTPPTSGAAQPPADGKVPPLPAFAAPADLGANCQYPAAEAASKPNKPPRTGKVPTTPAQVSVSMETNQGNVGIQLDNGKSPCTVNSFASLAQQGFFNDTPCHRLTTSPTLSVLQCGDPTGKGTGGPALQQPVTYPRGTLAMANAGPGTNGSQFFLVYKDSQLPPGYTVFGTIDDTGLKTLDKIAAAGTADGGQDGSPKQPVQIKSVLLDN